MKIAAVTRFKQGDLWKALRALNWTQSELARRTGFHQGYISGIINLRHKPGELAQLKIQKVFAESGIVLDVEKVWPSDFKGFQDTIQIEQIQEVSQWQLNHVARKQLPEAIFEITDEDMRCLEEAKSCLTPIQRMIVEKTLEGKNMVEIAKEHGVTPNSIRCCLGVSARKLRDRIIQRENTYRYRKMYESQTTDRTVTG